MKNILHIVASSRGKNSHSFNLGNEIVKKVISATSEYSLSENFLVKNPPPYLSAVEITAFYKDQTDRNAEEKKSLIYSDAQIKEIQHSDIIIISTPMYNMGIPALLKSWIDQIIRVNATFTYDNIGNKLGQLHNKKMYIAIASGRIHTPPKDKTDYIYSYLKYILKPIGITDISVFRTEGTARKSIEETNYNELIVNL